MKINTAIDEIVKAIAEFTIEEQRNIIKAIPASLKKLLKAKTEKMNEEYTEITSFMDELKEMDLPQ